MKAAAARIIAYFKEASVRGEALRIIVAAALLGFLFNQSSPLGVRMSPAAADAPGSAAPPAAAIAAPGSPYRLATLSMTWQESGGAAPAATPAAVPSTFAPAPAAAAQPAAGGRRKPVSITWAQAKQLLPAGNGIVIDARSEEAYNAGHITGAINLPYVKLSEKIKDFTTQYPDKSRMLLIYCNNTSCSLSVALGESLINDYGYTNVSDMPGGLVEWQTAMASPAP